MIGMFTNEGRNGKEGRVWEGNREENAASSCVDVLVVENKHEAQHGPGQGLVISKLLHISIELSLVVSCHLPRIHGKIEKEETEVL